MNYYVADNAQIYRFSLLLMNTGNLNSGHAKHYIFEETAKKSTAFLN
jgi:hypothetical protein